MRWAQRRRGGCRGSHHRDIHKQSSQTGQCMDGEDEAKGWPVHNSTVRRRGRHKKPLRTKAAGCGRAPVVATEAHTPGL